MRILDRQALRLQLMEHEGSGPMRGGRHLVYRCPAGALTIGYGRQLETNGLSPEEARDLLDHDIQACLEDLASFAWWGALDPIRQRALVDMRFQLGAAGFRGFSQMLAALDNGDYTSAAWHARDSTWARTDAPARAQTVTVMLETGEDV